MAVKLSLGGKRCFCELYYYFDKFSTHVTLKESPQLLYLTCNLFDSNCLLGQPKTFAMYLCFHDRRCAKYCLGCFEDVAASFDEISSKQRRLTV